MTSEKRSLFSKSPITLKESLFLGFCAVSVIILRMAFRWKLGLTGHQMFFTIFFFLIARGCVKRWFSATTTGFMVAIMSMLVGLGQDGLLRFVRYLLPGMVVDIGGMVLPSMTRSYLLCFVMGILASSTSFVFTLAGDWLVGMDATVMLQHAFINSLGNMLFGGTGSLLVPPVIKKLTAHGII